MFAGMPVKEQYRNFLIQLQDIYTLSEATLVADWVFESVASVKRSDILKHPDEKLPSLTKVGLQVALQQLLQHKPVQYVLGEAWFYNMKFRVNEHTLIPRPETEDLVEVVLQHRKTILADPAIIDIGTGCGCIPIAIKKHIPGARVSAIDISGEALEMARQNAELHHTEISFAQCDFLDESQWGQFGQFDMIVSNPPYVPQAQKETMEKNVVVYEPHVAIFVPDNDPQKFYKKIITFAAQHLSPGGKIFLETSETNVRQTAALFSAAYRDVSIKKDLYGKERTVIVST